LATEIGINKHLTFHLARHTFTTTVTLINDVPLETVSKLLGHTKLSTTQKYARVVEKKTTQKTKKENALDTVSKSFFNPLNFNVMNTIQNHVQLIGNLGDEPTVTNLENGKKVARLSLATNESYKDKDGEKQTETNWHKVVALGKTAEIIEKYAAKGKKIAVRIKGLRSLD